MHVSESSRRHHIGPTISAINSPPADHCASASATVIHPPPPPTPAATAGSVAREREQCVCARATRLGGWGAKTLAELQSAPNNFSNNPTKNHGFRHLQKCWASGSARTSAPSAATHNGRQPADGSGKPTDEGHNRKGSAVSGREQSGLSQENNNQRENLQKNPLSLREKAAGRMALRTGPVGEHIRKTKRSDHVHRSEARRREACVSVIHLTLTGRLLFKVQIRRPLTC
ncbi:hypothetical protein ANCCEY_12947 [Ancylostoma ceylanicum]|uniref:Uncharacterized protein n=2 Tax=Ancylostoma ceylanicum TaxID=53326 RepID=A0A8I3B0L0_9BILA|nr:hypothetical protein ANCCEY_12947 [Ancylostoma ceylanicum]EYB85569.1 hypothetical protein Y032_0296g1709 [Ancylostoma ceylanicum]